MVFMTVTLTLGEQLLKLRPVTSESSVDDYHIVAALQPGCRKALHRHIFAHSALVLAGMLTLLGRCSNVGMLEHSQN